MEANRMVVIRSGSEVTPGILRSETGGSDLIALLAIAVISAIILVVLGYDRRLERISPKVAAAQ
jgi:hypothetical protein